MHCMQKADMEVLALYKKKMTVEGFIHKTGAHIKYDFSMETAHNKFWYELTMPAFLQSI